jgi:hypothetical protein
MASALGGALVTVCFGVYNLWKAKENEREKWIRDSKLDAYSTYLEVTHRMGFAVSAYRVAAIDHGAMVNKFWEYAPGRLEILGPKDLNAAADVLDEYLSKLMNDARNPRIPSLEGEAAFEAELEELSLLRRRVIQLMQEDLGLEVTEYPLSGSELNTPSLATSPDGTATKVRRP